MTKTKVITIRKEGNVLFNDALNTFYLQLYGVGHMVKDHSDRESTSREALAGTRNSSISLHRFINTHYKILAISCSSQCFTTCVT